MQITVADNDEFIDKLYGLKSDVVDVSFSSSAYEDGVFDISCDDGYKRVALRGVGPTALVDSSLSVCGEEIDIDNFIFDSRRIFNAVLRAQGQKSVTIRRCAWLRSALYEQPGLSVLHIEPISSSTEFTLEDSWFIGNLTNEGHHILGTASGTSSALSTISIRRTAFIDNKADYIIGAISGNSITLQDCFIFSPSERPVFLGTRTKQANIRFSGCTIVAPSFRHIVSQWASDAAPGDFRPVVFEDCHIYLTGSSTSIEGIWLSESKHQQISSLPVIDYENWMASREKHARQGQAPDVHILRNSLGFS